jgi:NADPH2:quinone reductase
VGGARSDPGILRHRMDVPFPQPRTRQGPDTGYPWGNVFIWTSSSEYVGNAGAEVIATTRKGDASQKLGSLGAKRVEVEGPDLSNRISERKRIDAVLDLVGNSTILDSLAMLRRGGRACLAGFLGGLAPVPDFNPLLQMSSGVHFSFFGSFVFGTPGFPLSDVPLQAIASDVAAGCYKAKPVRVFRFEEIREAHKVMESGEAGGKMVVRV